MTGFFFSVAVEVLPTGSSSLADVISHEGRLFLFSSCCTDADFLSGGFLAQKLISNSSLQLFFRLYARSCGLLCSAVHLLYLTWLFVLDQLRKRSALWLLCRRGLVWGCGTCACQLMYRSIVGWSTCCCCRVIVVLVLQVSHRARNISGDSSVFRQLMFRL